MTTTYRVQPKRWDHGYELHIEGLGVTQVDDLSEAEEFARDFIALDLEVPEDSFNVEILPSLITGIEIPSGLSLQALPAWQRQVWTIPDLSVDERALMIAAVLWARGEISPDQFDEIRREIRRTG